jgi:hypothetical protein
MTRGRISNTAHVVTHTLDEEIPGDEPLNARDVFTEILRHSGAELSAHETIAEEQTNAASIAQLAAEYDTIVREAAAAEGRSTIYGWLSSTSREARSEHLHAADAPPRQRRRMIAGLIPAAQTIEDSDVRRALDERAELIEQRAATLVREALETRPRWLTQLGSPPHDPARQAAWLRSLTTIVAYRDRHHITSADILGASTGPSSWAYRGDRRRAQNALITAQHLARHESMRPLAISADHAPPGPHQTM